MTQIGNVFFAWFQSTGSTSSINFLELLRAGNTDYSLSDVALFYMKQQKLPAQSLAQLERCRGRTPITAVDWNAFLYRLSMTKQRHRRLATEGSLLGSVLKHGLCHDLVIVSDDAGQFNILLHALCRIHTERLIHKMLPLNETHRQQIAEIRVQIWCLYADLKRYKRKVSGGTRSDEGRRCRDSYASLKKTCRKLRISFWQYLKDRLGISETPVAYLPDMIIAHIALGSCHGLLRSYDFIVTKYGGVQACLFSS